MERIIEIEITGCHLTKSGNLAGVEGESDATTLEITFDESWDGFSKTIAWIDAKGENATDRILSFDELTAKEESSRVFSAKIPGSVLTVPGDIMFSVIGYQNGIRQKSVCATLSVRANELEPTKNDLSADEDYSNPTLAEVLQSQISSILNDVSDMYTKAPPKIINGTWHIWDSKVKDYVDTGLTAKGDKGEKGDQGEQGVRGPQGPQGPQGAQGPKGDTGAQGIQGDKGDKGENGKDGYTPQRGTDYWTPDDRAEIKTELDKMVLDKEDKSNKITLDEWQKSTDRDSLLTDDRYLSALLACVMHEALVSDINRVEGEMENRLNKILAEGEGRKDAKYYSAKATREYVAGQIDEEVSELTDFILDEEIVGAGEATEVDLLPLYPKESKVMSTASGKVVFYDNASNYTVFVPVEKNKTYQLKYLGNQYTYVRHAFLDENKEGLSTDYKQGEIYPDNPIVYTASDNGYYAICVQTSAISSIGFFAEVPAEEKTEYYLSSDVKLSSEHIEQVKKIVSKVEGKKIGVIGDSITYGSGLTTGDKRWWEYVKDRYGFASVYSNAEIGRAFTQDGMTSTRFTQKIKELPNDLDVIIVFGGVNDRAFNAPIGTMDDEPKEDNQGISFCSALRYTAEYLLTNHPNAQIIFMTPLPCNQSLGFNGKNANGHRLQDYADAIAEMCRAYGFDMVDLNHVGGFYVWSQNWLNTYMEDGIHPNNEGTKIYVHKGILPKLDSILVERT